MNLLKILFLKQFLLSVNYFFIENFLSLKDFSVVVQFFFQMKTPIFYNEL